MNNHQQHIDLEIEQAISGLKLASLWIFILFNMLFRDIHELANPAFIDKIHTQNVSEVILLASGVVISFVIAMIPLNLMIGGNIRQRLNLVAVAFTVLGLTYSLPGDLDDKWFIFIEMLILLIITYLSLLKPNPVKLNHQPSFRLL